MTREPIFVDPPAKGQPWPANSAHIGGPEQGSAEIAFAYRIAADVVFEAWLLKVGPAAHDDSVLIPAIFNYRHSLELYLKFAIEQLLDTAHHQLDPTPLPASMTDAEKRLSVTHSLKELSDHLARAAKEFDIPLSEKQQALLKELDLIDQTGQNFRYAFRKVGNSGLSHVRPSVVHFDVKKVMDRMGDACDDLESLTAYLLEVQDGYVGAWEP